MSVSFVYISMRDYKVLFHTLEQEVPEGLQNSVLMRIERVQIRRARVRFFVMGGSMIVLFVLALPAFQYMAGELNASGFTTYLSVLFSNSNIAFANWKEFGLVLLESLPVFGLSVFLVVAFGFFGTLRGAVKNVNRARLSFS